MKRWIAEWLWRMAVLAVLGVIAWQLLALRADLAQPVDEQTTAQAESDDTLDALRDEVAALTQKVDAILVVMARSPQPAPPAAH